MKKHSQRKTTHFGHASDTPESVRDEGAWSSFDPAPFLLGPRNLKAADNPLLAASQQRRRTS
jgi:hypothetical protein